MKIETLLPSLNAAVQNNALDLTAALPGVTWQTDLPAAIAANLGLTGVRLLTEGKAVQAPEGSVKDANGTDLPSAFLFGSLDSDLLNIPKARLQCTLYVTPVNATDDSTTVNFTLIAQIMPDAGNADWTPADSFPVLADSFVFDDLVATSPPGFLLTSFEHDQQWNVGGGTATPFTNIFPRLKTGLNLQVPSNFSTRLFPSLKALFGNLSIGPFDFNGQVDNTNTASEPKNLRLDLLADLSDTYNKTFTGTGDKPFVVEFDAGFQAIPVQIGPNPPDTDTAIVLSTQVIIQAKISKVLIQAVAPLTGNSLAFSMTGLDGLPAISLADVAALFDGDFLSDHLPQSLQQKTNNKGFFDYIGIENAGLTLNLPGGGQAPGITSILLKVGYPEGAPTIGYQPWIDLRAFAVTWFVLNPFSGNPAPLVSLSGDIELLKGIIGFEASFAKGQAPTMHSNLLLEAPTTGWEFDLQGGLLDVPDKTDPTKNTNVIHLSDLFERFSSASGDFPVEIDIDELAFEAKPEAKFYAGSFELDFSWNFKNYKAPLLNGFSLDITDDNGTITGSIGAQIAVGAAIFDLTASRTETQWEFSAQNEDEFSIGDLATAFNFDHPAYLDSIAIEKVNVDYIAPIAAPGGSTGTAVLNAENLADTPKSSTFSIEIEASFPIDHDKLSLDVDLKYTVEPEEWAFDGTLTVNPVDDPTHQLAFTFNVNSKEGTSDADTTLIASLINPSHKLMHISDIAAALGEPAPPLPDVLNELELTSVTFEYNTAANNGKGFLFRIKLGDFDMIFALVKTGDTKAIWKPFITVSFQQGINFNQLPVIGSHISDFGKIELTDIQIAGVPKVLSAADLIELSTLFTNADVPTSVIPNVGPNLGLPAEAIFNAVLHLNDESKPINLVFKSTSGGTNTSKALTAGKSISLDDGDGPVADIPANNSKTTIGKSFGPVTIHHFNLAYTDGKLGISVSGALALAGIDMSFQGMGISMKFPPKNITDVSFQLHGLGVNINKGSLRIAGGFITLDDNFDNFMGMLAITAGPIGMQAFGGYATTTPQPSFFIFVNVNVPIGGPPFFFIDGFAGGIGINREFILPDFEELPTFPLLPGAPNNPIPDGQPDSMDDVVQALTVLAKFIPPKAGGYWIAAGLDFMSFEIIQVDAILEVSFGAGLQIGLLASAAMSIPAPGEPIAYIQIDLEIDLDPDKGLLAVFGMLTPASYVFGGACHLSGGFGFFIWFKGPHEGDFLITIGGYHPAFKKPAWYPDVPRLAMTWNLGILKISGQAYFALTSHMIMAGLELSALFDIKIVKATFDAGFDFLLGWKPFLYLADAYIHITIELHIIFTISFHVGVDFNLWGPKFGGSAKIDLTIFSFTIHFGSDAPTIPPIAWSEFKMLLPNSNPDKAGSTSKRRQLSAMEVPASGDAFSVSQVQISKGLLQQTDQNPVQQSDLSNEHIFNWLIDPNAFEFLISAGVPCNNFYFNNDPTIDKGANINARDQTKAPYLTPATKDAYPGSYLKPDDLEAFYTHPDKQNADAGTQFAYDYPDKDNMANAWWNQPVQVGPVAIPPGTFNDAGMRQSGFASIFIVNVYQLIENQHGTITREFENNFVITLVSKNAAGSLWSDEVTAANGNSQLNKPATVPNTLFGITLSPKRWNPLQTRQIDIYELLFQDGNNMCWPAVAAPVVPANTFEETISSDGDTMTFHSTSGNTVQSQYRQLDPQAFSNLAAGKTLIDEIVQLFGFDQTLTVQTDQASLAAPVYKDWPVLALLGEEDVEAINQMN